MQPAPIFFEEPAGELVELRVAPQLASWMASGHPEQDRLEGFLSHAQEVLLPRLSLLPDPVALRLQVALPADVDLLQERDLDNYAFPLAARLTQVSGRGPPPVSLTLVGRGDQAA